jgi:hypothetical protein
MTVRSLCWAKMTQQACDLCTYNILVKSLCHFFHVRTSQFVCHLVILALHFCQHLNQLFDVFLKVVAGSQYIQLIFTLNSPPAQLRFVEFSQLLSEFMTEASKFRHRLGTH